MSQENVERVRRFVAELDGSGNGPARVSAFIHDDVEIDWSRSAAPFAGIYRGREEAMQFVATFLGFFEQSRWEATDFIEADDDVLVPHIAYFRGREGIEVQVSATFAFTICEGKCTRWCVYQNLTDALEAVGLSE